MTSIRAERLRRGWTQVELTFHARACGARLSVADVSRIECRRLRPYTRQIAAIAAALGVDVADLAEAHL